MEKEDVNKLKDFVRRIKAVNNQTENKIDVLQKILIEYNDFCKFFPDFRGYSISMLIDKITEAKTKRKNVSKRSIHQAFLTIKEDALFKIEHTVQ